MTGPDQAPPLASVPIPSSASTPVGEVVTDHQARQLRARLTPYVVPDAPKQLRETLCIAQARIRRSGLDVHRIDSDCARLQRLIDECDRLRPLGPGGNHDGPSERCTAYCGCAGGAS